MYTCRFICSRSGAPGPPTALSSESKSMLSAVHSFVGSWSLNYLGLLGIRMSYSECFHYLGRQAL